MTEPPPPPSPPRSHLSEKRAASFVVGSASSLAQLPRGSNMPKRRMPSDNPQQLLELKTETNNTQMHSARNIVPQHMPQQQLQNFNELKFAQYGSMEIPSSQDRPQALSLSQRLGVQADNSEGSAQAASIKMFTGKSNGKKSTKRGFGAMSTPAVNQDAQTEQKLRNVYVDAKILPNLHKENAHFCTNRISTTKYTIFSFLPKALLVQFMRMSNVYFLATAIITTIPGFSPISPASTFVPLTFVIFMSMMREAYEDFKRRTNDRLTNNRKCKVLKDKNAWQDLSKEKVDKWVPTLCQTKEECVHLRQSFQECLWQDLKCGDFLFIEEGEHLPADVVFLASSADNGECFVQTSSLDGERALKHKQCLVPVKKAIESYGLNNLQVNINCEAPNKNLYEFSGFIESEQFPEKGTIQLKSDSKQRTMTLDNKQLGLRGSNLANTAWAIAAVVYTGKDSKLMLNQGHSRFKQSRIEKVVNKMCVYLIIAQAIFCTIMSVYSGYYVSNYADITSTSDRTKAEYIFYTELSSLARNENGTARAPQSMTYSPTAEGFMTYGVYFVLLNTIIPLSLVVSIELIKLVQAPFIANDIKMYDETTMKQCQPMSMTLHEEMASISYIFADKTGTLTANVMQFKACTIGSVCYDEEYKDEDYEYEMDQQQESCQSPCDEMPPITQGEIQIEMEDLQVNADEYEQFRKENRQTFNEPGKEAKIRRRRNSITKIVWNFSEAQQIIKNLLERNRYFYNEETNLGQSNPRGPQLVMRKQNEYLHQFWLNVALCHDVITTVNHETNHRAYQGTSPDEITLLDAAKEVGYTFLDRNSEYMQIQVFGKEKNYRLLQKFEFTSDRKKMSVVLQDEQTGMVFLFSKGADLAIFDRLSTQIEQHFLDATKEDLIKFSTKGFRTLCFGMRVLDESYFKDWQIRYETAKLDVIKLGVAKVGASAPVGFDPNAMLLSLQNEIESELFLLGATALEDKLQDGVPEAIEDFRNAGIKVWMLTGDKLETAENIGFSSKMFNEKMFIFKLQTPDRQSTRNRLNQIDQKIFDIEKQHATPIIGTQFILNPNAAMDYEARNIIRALEEFKHESRASEFTLNDSWARKPILRRKVRKRLEEIVPDKNAIAERLIRENQVFFKSHEDQLRYVPQSFDLKGGQYIFKGINVYRSTASHKLKQARNSLQVGGIDLNIMNAINLNQSNIIDNEDKFGILIEGHTLHFIQDSKTMKDKFLKILAKCEAVVVCRASPSQKGQVVEMIKENEPDAVTLAIGDGANDVNMIQKAHIGIGIFGKEGYQAAGSSDYAIGQFKFLRRLLFVHGRWSGVRLTIFMLLFFNKNLAYTLPQFWFGWNNGYSGQAYYDEVYMSAFNLFATNFAICLFAVWEIDIKADDEKQQGIIDLFMPQVYQFTKDNELFTTKKFFAWSAVSILQSLFMYGIPSYTYSDYIFTDGMKQDFWAQSIASYFSLVILHYVTACYFTKNWTWWVLLWYSISVFMFAPFQIVTYDNFPGTPLSSRLKEIVFQDFQFWLTVFVSVAVCFIPFWFYFQANSLLFPTLKDLIMQENLDQKEVLNQADPKKAKEAMDILKKQQTEAVQNWDKQYNSFPLPSQQQQQQQNTQQNNNTRLLTNTVESAQNTPLKILATPGKRMRPTRELQSTVAVPKLEEIKEEEVKQMIDEVVVPFKGIEEENQLRNDISPVRLVGSTRKGLNAMRQNSNMKQGESGSKSKKHLLEQNMPNKFSPSPNEDEPLRITRSGATKSQPGFSPSPDAQVAFNNEMIIEEEEKAQSPKGEKAGSEDFLSDNESLVEDKSQLAMKMDLIKMASIKQSEAIGNKTLNKITQKSVMDQSSIFQD